MVEGDDVGMADPGVDLRLAQKTLDLFRIALNGLGQNSQNFKALHQYVPNFISYTLVRTLKQIDNFVVAHDLSRLHPHSLSPPTLCISSYPTSAPTFCLP